jgi:quercetin dioxygenase-like cupin family protein
LGDRRRAVVALACASAPRPAAYAGSLAARLPPTVYLMPHPPWLRVLALLASLAGCGSPKTGSPSHEGPGVPTTDFGRPAVLARNDGEARMLQGRKPIWIKVDPETLGSHSFTVGMEDMPPGDSIGVHKHLQEDEVVFIYRGRVQVTLGDSSRSAEAGGLVFIPRGTWIGFHVVGPDTATIVFMFNTPGFEKCLRFLSAPAGTPFVPRPPAEVAAARKECHQVRRVDEAH